MVRQLGLGTGWPDDQDRPGTARRRRDATEEFLVDRRMAAADRVGPVMKMHHPIVGRTTVRSTSSALKWKTFAW